MDRLPIPEESLSGLSITTQRTQPADMHGPRLTRDFAESQQHCWRCAETDAYNQTALSFENRLFGAAPFSPLCMKLEKSQGTMRLVWNDDIYWSELLWRYLKVSRFAEMLGSSQLYFAASTQFSDKFDGATAVLPPDFPLDPRFAPMDHMEDAYFKWRYLFKINCWHRAEYESNGMWWLYAKDSKGVAICLTPERMRAAIRPYYVSNRAYPEILWAGPVKYHDFLTVRLQASGKPRYFSKHRAFAWEREFRLLISMMEAHEFGVDVTREHKGRCRFGKRLFKRSLLARS